MKEMGYRVKAMEKATGLKRLTVHSWMELGLIDGPSIKKGIGCGSYHLWSKKDILQLKTMAKLIKNGVSRKFASKFVNSENWYPGKPFIIECPKEINEIKPRS